ncbi:MAG: MFS transporter [Armatimonadetes bacterium]|nr:MFS transporter [Armatimonadota bacterium]
MINSLRWRLSLMMFLEYAVWGAWTPILAATLVDRLNATGMQIGAVYGVLWLASIITPFIGGQLVDRYMPSQIFLGVAALVMAAAAWMMSLQDSFGGIIGWMWVWSLAFAPTLGITNSIAFHHLTRADATQAEQDRDFAIVRTAGTVGWIVAAFILTWYLTSKPAVPAGTWAPFEELQLTAVFGLILAVVSFLLLPHTPPSKEASDPWAFLKAFRLFGSVPGFTAFMLISFVVSTEFQFFYVLSAPFLSDLGIPHAWLSTTKSVSQIAEIIALAVFLPLSLKYLGMRKTLVIGVLAWPLRYFIFAMQEPLWLVVVSLTFHGIGFAFVFITSQIYVDRVAPKDIRASAQSLLTIVTIGMGNWIGTMFSGWLKDRYTTFVPNPQNPAQMIPGDVNWQMVFMIPGILTLLCAVAFWFTFIEPKATPSDKDREGPIPPSPTEPETTPVISEMP